MICLVRNHGALDEFQKYKVSMLLDSKWFEKHTDERSFKNAIEDKELDLSFFASTEIKGYI